MSDNRAQGAALIDFANALPKVPSLHVQWVRCGTTGCRCARGELHGPYDYLFWREDGRLRKRYVRPADVEAVRASCAKRRLQELRVRHTKDQGWQEWRALVDQVREAERHEQ